jgi:hypothetical protein
VPNKKPNAKLNHPKNKPLYEFIDIVEGGDPIYELTESLAELADEEGLLKKQSLFMIAKNIERILLKKIPSI